ncbi:MAG: hypothetical protein ACE5R6_01985 [Candidatus Heimdallarchaeota archaeon]
MPKDPASAPAEIRISKKIDKQGNEAMEQTKQSGREWDSYLIEPISFVARLRA